MPYSLISRLLGLLLLVTAGLKLHGVAVDPVGRGGVFSAPEWQIGIVEFEILLALWLLSGGRQIGSWMISILAFTTFATASLYQGWVGHTSCSCFGTVNVNPWITFGVDVGVVVLLSLSKPNLKPVLENPRENIQAIVRAVACGALSFAIVTSALLASIYLIFGSVPRAVAYFRGEQISLYPRLVDVGVGEPGDELLAKVEVTNWTDKPVRIFGGTSDCACSVLGDLPLTIEAGETQNVSVIITLRGKSGAFTRKAALLVDDGGYGVIPFRLTGLVKETPHSNQARE